MQSAGQSIREKSQSAGPQTRAVQAGMASEVLSESKVAIEAGDRAERLTTGAEWHKQMERWGRGAACGKMHGVYCVSIRLHLSRDWCVFPARIEAAIADSQQHDNHGERRPCGHQFRAGLARGPVLADHLQTDEGQHCGQAVM